MRAAVLYACLAVGLMSNPVHSEEVHPFPNQLELRRAFETGMSLERVLDYRAGALVVIAEPGHPLAGLGLRRGDRLVELDGQPMGRDGLGPAALSAFYRTIRNNLHMKLKVRRHGRGEVLSLKISDGSLPAHRGPLPSRKELRGTVARTEFFQPGVGRHGIKGLRLKLPGSDPLSAVGFKTGDLLLRPGGHGLERIEDFDRYLGEKKNYLFILERQGRLRSLRVVFTG